ncbi:MAG TPA: hypothetical protein VGX72_14075 [Solirubrobacteraceae bacterium]|nr:hypothetical protein [Solirubrobacteraceae bacterium]
MPTTTDELVSVLIPRPMMAEVYGLVVEYERAVELGETASDESGVMDEALVRRMYAESQPRHRELMKLLAEHPGEWLYTNQIASALKLPHGSSSAAGMLGAFGRRATHRYEGLKPWVSEWDPAAYEARHTMTADVAKIIRSL